MNIPFARLAIALFDALLPEMKKKKTGPLVIGNLKNSRFNYI